MSRMSKCGPNDPPGSTLNRGGNASARGGGDPFSYLKLGDAKFSYLGHFRQDKFIEEGHNTKRRVKVTSASGDYANLSNKSGSRSVSKRIDALSNRAAKKVLKKGDDASKAAVAAARPVQAARVAKRAAVAGATDRNARKAARSEGRAAVKAAKTGVESKRSERKGRKADRKNRWGWQK